jgi:hypothetical protein
VTRRRTDREEENALIGAALRALPPQRAWKVLEEARRRRINNRRARAVARDYLAGRWDADFDAVKYRSRVRAVAAHAHLKLAGERGPFLFRLDQPKAYATELFEQFRRAHYSAEAIYDLPFTVAEGLAAKHGVPRDVFLARIAPKMTTNEMLRLQGASERADNVDFALDLGRLPLTRVALYALSLTPEARRERADVLRRGLASAARRTLHRAPIVLPERVAAVLDNSYSASGSGEKRRRPLAVALGVHFLLQAAVGNDAYRAFWTAPPPEGDPLFVQARGQTDLATPLLDALGWGASTIVVVSDGVENDPPRGASEVLRVFRTRLDPGVLRTSIIHANPVFNADDLSLRALGPHTPTVGLRDAEDLPTLLGFARFAEGSAMLADLDDYLAVRVRQMLAGHAVPPAGTKDCDSP